MFIELELENTPTMTGCCAIAHNIKKMRWPTNEQQQRKKKIALQTAHSVNCVAREMAARSRETTDTSGMKKEKK